MADIGAKFVSQKINKIRWKNFTKNTLTGPDTFITGSWDDEVFVLLLNHTMNDKNEI